MIGTVALKKWNVKDLIFKTFITVDTVKCDKERENSNIAFFGKGNNPCSCPCPCPCVCLIQRK